MWAHGTQIRAPKSDRCDGKRRPVRSAWTLDLPAILSDTTNPGYIGHCDYVVRDSSDRYWIGQYRRGRQLLLRLSHGPPTNRPRRPNEQALAEVGVGCCPGMCWKPILRRLHSHGSGPGRVQWGM